jgi:hypothetical protein
MIVLSTSNEDGTAFIQTSSLDGEKSLKPRYAIHEAFCAIGPLKKNTFNMENASKSGNDMVLGEIPMNVSFNAYVEEPSISLYHFEGYMKIVENNHEIDNPIP